MALWAVGLPRSSAQVARGEVIYAKVYVDEEERTQPSVWRNQLGKRIEAASRVINRYANIHFAVGEFGTWQSDNRINDLNRSLREFEQEVNPAPYQLAIGFSSQYRFRKGINGLGGTRGPLHSHIMLRESSPNTQESDRLEALVHELGHYLGAAHSADQNSVMRTIIGDGRTRRRDFQIAFDPRNAQIIQMVGAEVSALGLRRFQQLSVFTRKQLMLQYRHLARELPKDPAAKRYIQLLQLRQ